MHCTSYSEKVNDKTFACAKNVAEGACARVPRRLKSVATHTKKLWLQHRDQGVNLVLSLDSRALARKKEDLYRDFLTLGGKVYMI